MTANVLTAGLSDFPLFFITIRANKATKQSIVLAASISMSVCLCVCPRVSAQ